VVEKTARLVEEVAVRREATERTETVRDTVRREEVEVTDNEVSGAPAVIGHWPAAPDSGRRRTGWPYKTAPVRGADGQFPHSRTLSICGSTFRQEAGAA
jgi:hypothetical protein